MALTKREVSTIRLLSALLAFAVLSNLLMLWYAAKVGRIAADQKIYMDGGCVGHYQGTE
jgi:hypothetical protein